MVFLPGERGVEMAGLTGIISDGDCVDIAIIANNYHSHKGNKFGGEAIWHDNAPLKKIHTLGKSHFIEKFSDVFRNLSADYSISAISPKDEQPLIFENKYGIFAIVTDGNISNIDEVAKKLLEDGVTFSESKNGYYNVTEVSGAIISQGEDYVSGIEKLWDTIDGFGSISLLLLTEDGIIAARDRRGTSPLLIGEKPGSFFVSNETTPFYNLDYRFKTELKAGQILLINKEGPVSKISGVDKEKICSFDFVYNDFPSAVIYGVLIEKSRNRSGEISAKRDMKLGIKADYCCGVPDSGIAYSIGRANASGIPRARALLKYTPGGFGRSYFEETQEEKDETAHYKIIALYEMIHDLIGIIDEDSLVRGTQLRKLIKKIGDCGPKGIHIRMACSPLAFPCIYNQSTREIHELAARKAINAIVGHDLDNIDEYLNPESSKHQKMVEWIRNNLNSLSGWEVVKTLGYQPLDDMIKSIGLPKERLCTYCWTGEK